jgi:hypothetical protein
LGALGVSAVGANAAVSYSTTGSTYTQDFSSLPNTPENASLETAATPKKWQDDTTATTSIVSIPGWYLYHSLAPTTGTPPVPNEGGTNGHQRLRAGTGSQNTGAFWSFGATTTTERSLGSVGSTTIATNPATPTPTPDTSRVLMGLRLNNATSDTLTSFTLTFDGEQWRDGGRSSVAETMIFEYQLGATALEQDAGWIAPAGTTSTQGAPNPAGGSNGSWTSPVQNASTTGAAVDGNVAGLVDDITVTVSGISWAPGTDLWLRWNDPQVGGNDHGMSIDNVVFSAAVPEPAALSLMALAGISALGRRRSR